MKGCNSVSNNISLTSLLGTIDCHYKKTANSKRKLSVKPQFRHRHEARNRAVRRLNAMSSARPPSNEDAVRTVPLQHVSNTLVKNSDHGPGKLLVIDVNSQDQILPLAAEDAVDVLKMGLDHDTPLSKLLDAFIEKIDGESSTRAASCLSSTEDEKDFEMSLCSVDMDVFPLEDDDANFGLSFSDMMGNSSSNLDFNGRCRKVKFAPEKDTVFEIPSHRTLSEQERLEMYNNSDAIRLQAYRNYAEWIWEGCDIANVVEEDKFCTDSDGNLLHPAHCVDESLPLANSEMSD
ncbi:hypothetical protein FisN_1Lh082 [Fistulifera solaris]|uniref:Uncharacterized protein n=1 Tax=Fistulifera solaris TaxID=1519565 RepID=A0A1Z5K4U2_FISSO|nr:hypothetical protein FisN_1Lh082 [Fistulifera solaris]|eukprot:GAX21253.1 hypothetical protein FisN_1Lh082 [Fistulifera solaris]